MIDRFFEKMIDRTEHVLSNRKLKRLKDHHNPNQRKYEIFLQYNSTIEAIHEETKLCNQDESFETLNLSKIEILVAQEAK